jgi:tetratricopeptide (TPR) repeat protein
MRNRSIHRVALTAAWLLILAGSASLAAAQRADPGYRSGSGIARIGGRVTDSEGEPLAGFEVRLSFAQNKSLVFKGKTGKKGDFAFANLGTGLWYLTVFGPGYEIASTSVIVSQIEKNALVRIELKRTSGPAMTGLIDDPVSLAELNEGNQLFQERKYAGALFRFESVLAKNPTLAVVRVAAADCRLELSDLMKAEADYQIVLAVPAADPELGPKERARACVGLGRVRIGQGRPAEAGDLFKKAAAEMPEDEILAYNIGEVCFAAKSYEEAIIWLRRASDLKPDWPDAHLRLGHAYLAKGAGAEAVPRFERFLALEPESDRAASVRAILATIKT